MNTPLHWTTAIALTIATAGAAENPNLPASPSELLSAFKTAVVAKTKLTLCSDVIPPAPTKKGTQPGEPRKVAKSSYVDRLHPDGKGYQIWYDSIKQIISE